VSLILDALKKLEREKDSGEPGVVIVKSVPWGETTRTRRWLILGITVLAGIVLAGVATRVLTRTPKPPPARPGTATTRPGPIAPAAVPSTSSSSTAPPTGALAPPPDRRLALPAPAPAETAAPAPARTPPSPAARRADDLRLNAISQREGRPVALINDHLVFEGDSFDGVRILRIGETEVEVEVEGRRHVLRF